MADPRDAMRRAHAADGPYRVPQPAQPSHGPASPDYVILKSSTSAHGGSSPTSLRVECALHSGETIIPNHGFRVLCCCLLLVAATQVLGSESSTLKQLFDDYNEAYLQLHPENATLRGDNRYNDRLGDNISDDFLRRDEALQRDALARLLRIDRAALEIGRAHV